MSASPAHCRSECFSSIPLDFSPGRVCHDEDVQRRHRFQSAEFFECAWFHWDSLELLDVMALGRGISLTISQYRPPNCRTTLRRNRGAGFISSQPHRISCAMPFHWQMASPGAATPPPHCPGVQKMSWLPWATRNVHSCGVRADRTGPCRD